MAKKSGMKMVNVSNAAGVPILEASNKRWGVILFPAQIGRICISDRADVTTANGLCINTTITPVTFNVRDHGDFWARQLFAIASGAGESLGIVEIFEDEYDTNRPPVPHVRGDE